MDKKEARHRLYNALIDMGLAELDAQTPMDLSPEQAFGVVLHATRRSRDITAKELARRTKIREETISRLENGLRQPTPRTVHDLARGLKVPEWQLNPNEVFKDVPGWEERRERMQEVLEKEQKEVVVSETKK